MRRGGSTETNNSARCRRQKHERTDRNRGSQPVAAGDNCWPVNFGRISFLMRRKQDNLATAMFSTCGCSLKSVVGACLLSAVVAGTICALTDRVVASNASAIVATVDRT